MDAAFPLGQKGPQGLSVEPEEYERVEQAARRRAASAANHRWRRDHIFVAVTEFAASGSSPLEQG
ncbi:hypothetical protein C0Q92_01800 [Streptomyces albidoflavus]|uniref:Uncharacterized protein n=1 Tax=Streptomyces albidoflavus TaxID=1886 RepID=A0A8G2E775_9ACTN|nr:hypothetical protein ADL32_08360 [Streptomyces albidoflavus]RZE29137.1 hypothetical protein C0Q92_01800 [Streptomyces albidoflavus]RZE49375.1 hypothetical protein C0Q95_01085 [Streptomyces albidoflavus]